jgi:hypothetical protein
VRFKIHSVLFFLFRHSHPFRAFFPRRFLSLLLEKRILSPHSLIYRAFARPTGPPDGSGGSSRIGAVDVSKPPLRLPAVLPDQKVHLSFRAEDYLQVPAHPHLADQVLHPVVVHLIVPAV